MLTAGQQQTRPIVSASTAETRSTASVTTDPACRLTTLNTQCHAYRSHARVRTLPGTPIWIGDGEVIWRAYKAVQLRTRQQGEGTLFVTDTRVVFFARAKGRGTQRPSMLVQQTKLENITGLAAYVSRRLSLTLFLLVCFGAFASLISIVTFPPMGLLLGVLTVAGIIALIRGAAKQGSTGVIINAGATDSSPIGFGQFGEQRSRIGQLIHAMFGPLFALFGIHTAFDVLIGIPGEQSEQVIAELVLAEGYYGGCVSQLQNELNTYNGTDMPVDGIFGAATRKAVETFQQNHHIVPADGIVGPQTKAVLDDPTPNPATGPTVPPDTAPSASEPSTPNFYGGEAQTALAPPWPGAQSCVKPHCYDRAVDFHGDLIAGSTRIQSSWFSMLDQTTAPYQSSRASRCRPTSSSTLFLTRGWLGSS